MLLYLGRISEEYLVPGVGTVDPAGSEEEPITWQVLSAKSMDKDPDLSLQLQKVYN